MRDIMGGTRAQHATQVHGVVAVPAESEESERVLPDAAGEPEMGQGMEPATQLSEAQAAEPEATEPKPKNKVAPESGHRAGWWMAMVGIGAVVGMLIVGYLKFIDGPTTGTATANSLETARSAAAPKKETPNLLSGMQIELQYPSEFDTVGQVKTDARAIEQYNIGSKADYSRTIAVSVRPLPGGLDDDSSYRFRQIKKDEYRETKEIINTEPVVIMVKQDRLEQTLFWVHAGKEVTVSITVNNPKDDVAAYMQQVKTTLRWRK